MVIKIDSLSFFKEKISAHSLRQALTDRALVILSKQLKKNLKLFENDTKILKITANN